MKRIKCCAVGIAVLVALTTGVVANADSLQDVFFMNLKNSSIVLTCDQSNGYAQIKTTSGDINTIVVSCLVQPTDDPENQEPVKAGQKKLYLPIVSK